MKGWNKEKIEEQLKLHKKQNKDDRYNYFSREFNCLYYCWELEKYTIKEIERLNNIINELEEYIDDNYFYDDVGMKIFDVSLLEDKIKELKESGNN